MNKGFIQDNFVALELKTTSSYQIDGKPRNLFVDARSLLEVIHTQGKEIQNMREINGKLLHEIKDISEGMRLLKRKWSWKDLKWYWKGRK